MGTCSKLGASWSCLVATGGWECLPGRLNVEKGHVATDRSLGTILGACGHSIEFLGIRDRREMTGVGAMHPPAKPTKGPGHSKQGVSGLGAFIRCVSLLSGIMGTQRPDCVSCIALALGVLGICWWGASGVSRQLTGREMVELGLGESRAAIWTLQGEMCSWTSGPPSGQGSAGPRPGP